MAIDGSSTTRIKICCILNATEIDTALAEGVDAVGLVGPMPSGPGTLSDTQIAGILREVPDAPSVLLTSETDIEAVCAHVARIRPKILQMVDAVEPSVVPALRILQPKLKIWQVIHVRGVEAIDAAKRASEHVDAILLDSGAPDAAVKTLGGTGNTHNWDISARIVEAVDKPVWLAGGLNPRNVAAAIAQVRPYGVDVCSGLRPSKHLDKALLEEFVSQVRGAP